MFALSLVASLMTLYFDVRDRWDLNPVCTVSCATVIYCIVASATFIAKVLKPQKFLYCLLAPNPYWSCSIYTTHFPVHAHSLLIRYNLHLLSLILNLHLLSFVILSTAAPSKGGGGEGSFTFSLKLQGLLNMVPMDPDPNGTNNFDNPDPNMSTIICCIKKLKVLLFFKWR